ncbi:MAG TPA: carboxypeptidase-like regulatory domain-containing protein, partial [Pyrinomonadaceae bacterium]|nr:carboxypeptidase-like regulatory domain-containing protein [Pyrinomonadaceae bacterium]
MFMRTWLPRFVAVALMTAAVCSASALSQDRNATIRGVLLDPNGEAIAGADITLMLRKCRCDDCDDKVKCDCCPARKATTTTEGGRFTFEVPPGAYQVTVVAAGFKPLSADVNLSANEVQEVTLKAEVGPADGAVQVTAPAAGVADAQQPAAAQQAANATVSGQAQGLTAQGKRVPLAGAEVIITSSQCRCDPCDDKITCDCCPGA